MIATIAKIIVIASERSSRQLQKRLRIERRRAGWFSLYTIQYKLM